jgi:hypothetical protein
MKSDSEIKQEVMDELCWDPCIDETNMGLPSRMGW